MVFQKRILLVSKTKVIQFMLFYAAEADRMAASVFVSLLFANVLDMDLPADLFYATSTFYLTSFVIRSTHLSSNTITKIAHRILDHLRK